MTEIFPETEPYEHGMLNVDGGQLVYWEACGNPHGKPVVVLHGGPGSGCTKGVRRLFDPVAYRVVLFDQRGAGRSTPNASQFDVDLSSNTTQHLVGDIERLREHLGIDRWMVFGGSWGSTLGLAYAEAHPERVTELLLFSVTTSRPSDIQWLYHGVGRFFPDAWARFREGVPEDERDGDLVEAYHRLLNHGNRRVRERAARRWCDWEGAVISVNPRHEPPSRYRDPQFRLGFARLVTHYFVHDVWLQDGVLLRDAHRIAHVPSVLIHGRLDLGTPLATAWELARALPHSELVVVDEAGHETKTLGMQEAIRAATDRFSSGSMR